MANHYYSLNRGEEGFTSSDFSMTTTGTSGDDIELRLADAASLTRKDVKNALEAFERLFEAPGSQPGGTNFPDL